MLRQGGQRGTDLTHLTEFDTFEGLGRRQGKFGYNILYNKYLYLFYTLALRVKV